MMLVYTLDRWTRYIWKQFVSRSPRAQGQIDQGERRLPGYAEFVAEIFLRLLINEPRRLDTMRPESEWALKLHQQLDALPGFDRLRRRCRGDRLLSGEVSVELARQLPLPDKPLTDPEPLRRQVRGLLDFGRSAKDLQKQGREAVKNARAWARSLDASALRQGLRVGIANGDHTVNHIEAAVAAFAGWGESGAKPEFTPTEIKAELARRVAGSPKLRALALEAGRLRRIAAHKQRSKADQVRDEVCDVERGNDLSRLLPSELLRITHPILKLDFARRYWERSLLQYRLAGTERRGRGPVIICLDQSSSMRGPKEIWSKALALALLEVATRQRRHCRVLHFNTGLVRVDDWAPGRVAPLDLLASMEPFAGGGTAFEPPLREALAATVGDMSRADVVLVTDGLAQLNQPFLGEWNAARRAFCTYAIHVDALAVPPGLAAISDRVIALSDVAQDLEATDAVLDI